MVITSCHIESRHLSALNRLGARDSSPSLPTTTKVRENESASPAIYHTVGDYRRRACPGSEIEHAVRTEIRAPDAYANSPRPRSDRTIAVALRAPSGTQRAD